jgi:CBS domain-containing protein
MYANDDVMCVREAMNPSPRMVSAGMSVADALAWFAARGFAGAPVVRDDGTLAGVFTEMDGLRVLTAAAWHGAPVGTVAEHMTRSVQAISPSDDVFLAAQMMLASRLRVLPVCEDGRVVGILSVRDLDRALRRLFDGLQVQPDHPPGAAWDPRASAARDRRADQV